MTEISTKQSVFFNIKNSKTICFINKILYSVWGIAILAILSVLTNTLSLEIPFYIIICVTTVYISIFGTDLLPLIPIFLFCYISPSTKNNPALSTNSVFYNQTGLIIGIILAICIPSIILRICLDKNMGLKKLFTEKRVLLWGMIALGIAYLLSGIGSAKYLDNAVNNLVFATLQFLSIFLLYYILTATTDWKNVNKSYFAWVAIFVGLAVSMELIHIYLTENVIQSGSIIRGKLYTGWGHYNNMGALIAMSIPFPFYLACKNKHNYLYLLLASLLLVFLILSCSRGSIVGGAFIYILSLIITLCKANNKKCFRISVGVLFGIVAILCAIFNNFIIQLFEKVPSIINTSSNSLSFNDSSRFDIYKEGFNAFLKYPIFGQSFYPTDFVPYDFSTLDSFSSFFPPRWHNTIIQILSSCGIIGIVAYLYHRLQTIKLIFKNRSLEKTFIGLSILVLLITSLLDCHFFNIGPTLFYSTALAFAEKISDNKTLEHQEPKEQTLNQQD